jgi:uncharacterized Tic20 family protein
MEDRPKVTHAQIQNLRKRLSLTRNMQIFGAAGLLLCVATMFLIYIDFQEISVIVFGIALVLFIISSALSVWELLLSTKSLKIYLSDMDQ